MLGKFMKKALLLILFSSTILYGQEMTLNLIKDYGPFNSTGHIHAIIYFIPFDVLTRYPYNIDDVKRVYDIKIEIRETRVLNNFFEKIENTAYITTFFNPPNRPNLRCVVEFFYNNALIFTYSSENGQNIIIDNKIINNENEFVKFIRQYLPEKYSY
jgi:hypothetical protein